VPCPTEKYFNYQTNRDATYWFTVRTVDQAGRMYPPSLSQAQQILKVCVDTQPPAVDLHPLSTPNGSVAVEWQIRDDNLNLDTLVLEYRVGGLGEWGSLGAERLAASKKVWNPATQRRTPGPLARHGLRGQCRGSSDDGRRG